MIHEFKVWTEFFKHLGNDGKNFEVRKDDRKENVNIGDTLILKEVGIAPGFTDMRQLTGKSRTAVVTYVLDLGAVPGLTDKDTFDFKVYGLRFQ